MILTNVSPEQLAALRNNFDTVVISEAEEKGKYDIEIPMNNELDAWKFFFFWRRLCNGKIQTENRITKY